MKGENYSQWATITQPWFNPLVVLRPNFIKRLAALRSTQEFLDDEISPLRYCTSWTEYPLPPSPLPLDPLIKGAGINDITRYSDKLYNGATNGSEK